MKNRGKTIMYRNVGGCTVKTKLPLSHVSYIFLVAVMHPEKGSAFFDVVQNNFYIPFLSQFVSLLFSL